MSKRTYSGKIYPRHIKSKNELDLAMKWLVASDPFPGAREGNAPCNSGETIESALGQPPSTKKIDFVFGEAKVELKSGRGGVTTPDTLGTRILDSWTGLPYSGKSRSQRFEQFVREFAFRTEMQIEGISGKFYRNNLMIDLTHTPHKKTKLFLDFIAEEDRIWVCEMRGSTPRRLLFWDQTDIDELSKKMKIQYYALVTQEEVGKDLFTYDVVSVMCRKLKFGRLTPKIVFEQIKLGNLLFQFRAHVCTKAYCGRTGCPKFRKKGINSVRCRGTALRVPKGRAKAIFEITKIA